MNIKTVKWKELARGMSTEQCRGLSGPRGKRKSLVSNIEFEFRFAPRARGVVAQLRLFR